MYKINLSGRRRNSAWFHWQFLGPAVFSLVILCGFSSQALAGCQSEELRLLLERDFSNEEILRICGEESPNSTDTLPQGFEQPDSQTSSDNFEGVPGPSVEAPLERYEIFSQVDGVVRRYRDGPGRGWSMEPTDHNVNVMMEMIGARPEMRQHVVGRMKWHHANDQGLKGSLDELNSMFGPNDPYCNVAPDMCALLRGVQ